MKSISLIDIIRTKTCLITKRGASFDDMLTHTWPRFHKTDSFDGLGSCKTADVCSVKRFANNKAFWNRVKPFPKKTVSL